MREEGEEVSDVDDDAAEEGEEESGLSDVFEEDEEEETEEGDATEAEEDAKEEDAAPPVAAAAALSPASTRPGSGRGKPRETAHMWRRAPTVPLDRWSTPAALMAMSASPCAREKPPLLTRPNRRCCCV
jgi:hypothetical protein